jgi:hypothetical protein
MVISPLSAVKVLVVAESADPAAGSAELGADAAVESAAEVEEAAVELAEEQPVSNARARD